MQNTIFISDELQQILDRKAANIGISTAAYITDILENTFKDELHGVTKKSFATLYTELRNAVIDYKNTLNPGDRFTLRDVPYYAELSSVELHGTHIVPKGLRVRLGRSINEAISKRDDPAFNDVERTHTKSGKLAFDTNGNSKAAIYNIKIVEEKQNEDSLKKHNIVL